MVWPCFRRLPVNFVSAHKEKSDWQLNAKKRGFFVCVCVWGGGGGGEGDRNKSKAEIKIKINRQKSRQWPAKCAKHAKLTGPVEGFFPLSLSGVSKTPSYSLPPFFFSNSKTSFHKSNNQSVVCC